MEKKNNKPRVKKSYTVRLNRIDKANCREIWETKPGQEEKVRYFSRDIHGLHGWCYSGGPYSEDICCVENNVQFEICDKQWNPLLVDGTNKEQFPASFHSLEQLCKQNWSEIKDRFPDVKEEGLQSWLEEKMPKDVSDHDRINWSHSLFTVIKQETLASFTFIGETYNIIRVHKKHSLCPAEWYVYLVKRENRKQHEDYSAWFDIEFQL